eukprot:TRINITY_DN10600_c0_g2_i1.p1 TRINITY_DN10600_c0_g2~~TRINITY_DN10600_c0_g2_i1.p1  ORF type:complete len:175 (+),score=10.10 TRINITY_DN10600_c0_g2_i1:100-624(+)
MRRESVKRAETSYGAERPVGKLLFVEGQSKDTEFSPPRKSNLADYSGSAQRVRTSTQSRGNTRKMITPSSYANNSFFNMKTQPFTHNTLYSTKSITTETAYDPTMLLSRNNTSTRKLASSQSTRVVLNKFVFADRVLESRSKDTAVNTEDSREANSRDKIYNFSKDMELSLIHI